MNFFSKTLPYLGVGEGRAFEVFQEAIKTKSTRLGSDVFFAHMDPPTPEIVSNLVGLNARYNQNLLHPDLSPLATRVEKTVIDWMAAPFGMGCGHMCAGSTLANITALWAAREAGADRVIASMDAHLSVPKAAHILGLKYSHSS